MSAWNLAIGRSAPSQQCCESFFAIAAKFRKGSKDKRRTVASAPPEVFKV
jgi:hypothetical protein